MSKSTTHSNAPVTMTTGWQDVGDEVSVGNRTALDLWVEWTINNSVDLQFRILYRLESDGTDYLSPILTPSGSKYLAEAEVFEMNVDADGAFRYQIPFNVSGSFIQLQAKVGTVGATAATVDTITTTTE